VEELRDPPAKFTIPPIFHSCPAGSRLWRIYFGAGAYPTRWNTFRFFGPTSSRFDHHLLPKSVQTRGILYATSGPDAVLAALGEVFQETRVIDRRRNEPWLTAIDLKAPLQLLDTGGDWPVRAGGNMAINSGNRGKARAWSRVIYDSYPDAEGIWYPSSITNRECAALYERASDALPAAPAFNERLDSPKLLASLSQLAGVLNYDLV
jgi:hypothetical protein